MKKDESDRINQNTLEGDILRLNRAIESLVKDVLPSLRSAINKIRK